MSDTSANIQFSDSDRFLRAALSGLAARQRVISNNVANVDTPNFKASVVNFEDVLRDAVAGRAGPQGGSQAALNARVSQALVVDDTEGRADGNHVDIDREMVQLAETTLSFGALTQVMAARLAIMRSVISDGRR
jgi:flagellar basal-body rod protein FlgB